MKITITPETPEEIEKLKSEEITYRFISDFSLLVRCKEGDVIPKDYSRSYGDVLLLIGQASSLLAYLHKKFME